jgi:hypothetical protein
MFAFDTRINAEALRRATPVTFLLSARRVSLIIRVLGLPRPS